MPEWPMGTDCKSVGGSLRRFESYSAHHPIQIASVAQGQSTSLVKKRSRVRISSEAPAF